MQRLSFGLVVASILLVDCKEASSPVATTGAETPGPGAGNSSGYSAPSATSSIDHSVVEHHGGAARTALFVEPTFTEDAVTTLHQSTAFGGAFTGNVHAQPLYTASGPNGHGAIFVATMSNDLLAFDETDGSLLWSRNFG